MPASRQLTAACSCLLLARGGRRNSRTQCPARVRENVCGRAGGRTCCLQWPSCGGEHIQHRAAEQPPVAIMWPSYDHSMDVLRSSCDPAAIILPPFCGPPAMRSALDAVRHPHRASPYSSDNNHAKTFPRNARSCCAVKMWLQASRSPIWRLLGGLRRRVKAWTPRVAKPRQAEF